MKRLILLLLLLAAPAQAAITFDATDHFTDVGVSVHNYSLTVGSCSNSIVVVDVVWSDGDADTISSVTVGGSGGTLIDNVFLVDVGNRWLASYYVLGLTAGSQAIVITFSGIIGTVNSGARSYCGVNQATPIGTAVQAAGDSAGPASATISAVVGELGISTAHARNEPFTAFSGTDRYNHDDGFSISGQDDTDGGTMTHSFGASTQWGIIAVPLKPAAAAPTFIRRKPILMQ